MWVQSQSSFFVPAFVPQFTQQELVEYQKAVIGLSVWEQTHTSSCASINESVLQIETSPGGSGLMPYFP